MLRVENDSSATPRTAAIVPAGPAAAHHSNYAISLAWNTRAFGIYDCNMDMNRLDLVRAVPDWLGLTNNGSKDLTDRRVRETTMF